MRKPIFVVQLGCGHNNLEDKQKIANNLKYLEENYYVLICFNNSGENKFELFSDEDVEPIDLDELKLKLGLND